MALPEQDSELFDDAAILPLLIKFLFSFVPELRRHGYYTAPIIIHDWYSMDLPVARDPIIAATTRNAVHVSYVIDCGRPSLMVSLSPYRLHDISFSEDWMRGTIPEFMEMLRTADRAPLVAQVLKALEEAGRVSPQSPKHWIPPKKDQ